MGDHVGSRDEVQRGDDDFVAWAAARREEGEMECCRSARHGDRVPAAALRCEGLLELLDGWAHAPPARRDDIADGVENLLIDEHVRKRNSPLSLAALAGVESHGRGFDRELTRKRKG